MKSGSARAATRSGTIRLFRLGSQLAIGRAAGGRKGKGHDPARTIPQPYGGAQAEGGYVAPLYCVQSLRCAQHNHETNTAARAHEPHAPNSLNVVACTSPLPHGWVPSGAGSRTGVGVSGAKYWFQSTPNSDPTIRDYRTIFRWTSCAACAPSCGSPNSAPSRGRPTPCAFRAR